MIQDISPHKYRNEYRPKPPERDSYILYYEGTLALVKKHGDNDISFPTFGEMEKWNEGIYKEYIFLFTIDDKSFYLKEELRFETDGMYVLEPRQRFREWKPKFLAFAGITGYQLYSWYKSRKYCGRCGSKMKHDEVERMMRCPDCGLMEYPKICPAVIVGVTDGNRLLMTKYAGRDYKKYALIAGFAEIGETIEDTVRREVMEEAGLKVKNIRFYKSQPWSFTDTLLFGFFAELDGDDTITLDEEELSFAEWFEREEIPVHEKTVSLTNEMILYFKNGGEKY